MPQGDMPQGDMPQGDMLQGMPTPNLSLYCAAQSSSHTSNGPVATDISAKAIAA
jgi:hypothetical protein